MSCIVLVRCQDHCNLVKNKCIASFGCGMALHTFYIACASLISGDTNECSTQCEKALISLVWAEDTVGRQFINCNCTEGDQHCEDQKARIEVCDKNVRKFDKSAVVKCSLAQLLCEADTECQFALAFYWDHCAGLIRGEKCTARCNNSLTVLYQLESAKKYLTCECDGTEEFQCMKIRRYTERLCFFKEDETRVHNGNHRSTSYITLFMAAVVIVIFFQQNDT